MDANHELQHDGVAAVVDAHGRRGGAGGRGGAPAALLQVPAIAVGDRAVATRGAAQGRAQDEADEHEADDLCVGRKQEERAEALKLLRRVELIVGEVSVRLMHVENQVEDLLANEGKEETEHGDADGESEPHAPQSSLGSYYHFDSKGNKLKTKWDTYDVDAELDRLDREDQDDAPSALTTASTAQKTATRRSKPTMDKPKLLTAIGGLEHEFEAVLEFLDDVRGDEQVKEARKALVSKINSDQLARIDALRAMLK